MAGCNRVSLPWQHTLKDSLVHVLQPAIMPTDNEAVMSGASMDAFTNAVTLLSKQHTSQHMGMPKTQPLLPSSSSTIQYDQDSPQHVQRGADAAAVGVPTAASWPVSAHSSWQTAQPCQRCTAPAWPWTRPPPDAGHP